MHHIRFGLLLLLPAVAASVSNPFLGHWDFNVVTPGRDVGANWLGVSEKGGTTEIWWQPTGGNVYEVKDFKLNGNHLTLNLRNKMTWDLDAAGDKLTGKQNQEGKTIALSGVRAPELRRPEPKAWSTPEPLFNGKDLSGWEPIGDPAKSHWKAEGGMMVNSEHGDNLKTTRQFTDFKVHFEVNCPDKGNSGFYLRGRYETQIEYEPLTANPPERRIGSIYGRITPKDSPRTPGQWETFDITLVGRTVTIVRNGITTVDHQVIDGITGGALNASEGEPGPFYIQGDHTGGLKFRNLTVSVPK